jgi:hypothetical protein
MPAPFDLRRCIKVPTDARGLAAGIFFARASLRSLDQIEVNRIKMTEASALALTAGTIGAASADDLQTKMVRPAAGKFHVQAHLYIAPTGARVFLNNQQQTPRVGEVDERLRTSGIGIWPDSNFYDPAGDMKAVFVQITATRREPHP